MSFAQRVASQTSPHGPARRSAAQGVGRYEVGTQLASGGMGTIFSAYVIELDTAGFERHFTDMVQAFRSTDNPILIQQCRRLLAEAQKRGVAAAPSWEEHQLVQPANSRDLTSQAPDITELVETG
jgi:hypothetical protein